MKINIILFLVLLTWMSSCKQHHQEKHNFLRVDVEGNHFVVDGKAIQFRGLNAPDPDRLDKVDQLNEAYFREMAMWGANIVRFPVHPEQWKKRGQAEYLKILHQAVDLASRSGLYSIIDWHSIGNLGTEKFQSRQYITTRDETRDFWQIMAIEFGEDERVAFFEIFNEPTTIRSELGDMSWQEWKELNEEFISIIRDSGAKTVPLIAGFDWAYDLTEIRDNPINAENIGYVSHPYPQKREKPWQVQWESDWGYVADTYPVFLTEIGFCTADQKGAHIPVIDDGAYASKIIDYANSKSISYAVWVFDTDWSPMLLKNWNYQPTEAGAVWKELLQNSRKEE